jgi:hypothetical protein
MKHVSKKQIEADQLRAKIESLLEVHEGWRHHGDQRDWLRKLMRQDASYIFTENERKAVGRIAYMRTFFEGWDGYSVSELVRDAQQGIADFDFEDEKYLNEIKHATRLTRADMAWLVGLCRAAGLTIRRFDQKTEEYEYVR